MGLIKLELDNAGIQELLHSDEMKAVLEEEANKRNPGSGYKVEVFDAGTRLVAKIETNTPAAYKDNLKHNTLLKAFGGNIKRGK